MNYHTDNCCGSCNGPLEVDRDAICHTCAPPEQYFRHCAQVQMACEAWRDRCRRRWFLLLGLLFLSAAAAAGWAWIVWG